MRAANRDYDALCEELCDHIADGGTRADFLEAKRIDKKCAWREFSAGNPERWAKIRDAYVYRAQGSQDRIEVLRERLLTGEVNATAGRIVLDSLHREAKDLAKLYVPQAPEKPAPQKARDSDEIARRLNKASGRGKG